jgi:hypothetical protein
LERLIEEMEKVDLSRPGAPLPRSIDGIGETEEVERIELAFLRMISRLESERRRAGSAAPGRLRSTFSIASTRSSSGRSRRRSRARARISARTTRQSPITSKVIAEA